MSVVIPIYNMGETLKKTVYSLEKSNYKNLEIILVDDCSEENILNAKEFSCCKKINLKQRSGPGAARNRGVQIAEGEIILFIDADVEVELDTVHKVVAFFETNKQADAVVGDYTLIPGQLNFVSVYKNLFHTYYHNSSKKETSTFLTACSAVKKEVFLKVGGFTEGVGPAVEDIELGYKLKLAGYKSYLMPDIKVKHNKRFTFRNLIKTDLFGRGIPWVKIMYKHKYMSNDLNTDYKGVLSVFSVYLFLLLIPTCIWMKSCVYTLLILMILFIVLNWKFFLYMRKNKGFLFSMETSFLLFIYYICCGLSVVLGSTSYFIEKVRRK